MEEIIRVEIKTKKYLDLLEELNKLAEKYNVILYENSTELFFRKLELFEYKYPDLEIKEV